MGLDQGVKSCLYIIVYFKTFIFGGHFILALLAVKENKCQNKKKCAI